MPMIYYVVRFCNTYCATCTSCHVVESLRKRGIGPSYSSKAIRALGKNIQLDSKCSQLLYGLARQWCALWRSAAMLQHVSFPAKVICEKLPQVAF